MEKFMTPEDAKRIHDKHLKAKAVLSHVEKGEEGNLIDLRAEFARQLFYNNPSAYQKFILDSQRKVK